MFIENKKINLVGVSSEKLSYISPLNNSSLSRFEFRSEKCICNLHFVRASKVFTLRLILPEYHSRCVGGSFFRLYFFYIYLYISYKIVAIFVIIYLYFFHSIRLRQLVTSKADRKFRSPIIDCGCKNVP